MNIKLGNYRMQQPQQAGSPNWLPPFQIDWMVATILVILGANIEKIPEQYHTQLGNPLIFLIGMLFSAGLAALKQIPIAFAIAFFLVNLIRLMPRKQLGKEHYPGKKQDAPTKEGFVPSGTMDWVTTQKKWFVEKVLNERPVGIQEKEVSTYPIQA
jgi:hypothetical protein